MRDGHLRERQVRRCMAVVLELQGQYCLKHLDEWKSLWAWNIRESRIIFGMVKGADP